MTRAHAMYVVFAVMIAGGCAPHPRDIAPMYVSDLPYQSLTCDQLRSELLNVNTALNNTANQQVGARASDAAGIVMIGLPVASMASRDSTAQVAALKGAADAMKRAGAAKNCGSLAPVIKFD